jgi:WD40 repeat protein
LIQLWELATGKELLAYRGAEGNVFLQAIAFSPDGRRLAAGYEDSTALIWDLTPRNRHPRISTPDLRLPDLNQLWSDLAGADAGKAHAAVWALVAEADRAVRLLKTRLTAAEAAGSAAYPPAHR